MMPHPEPRTDASLNPNALLFGLGLSQLIAWGAHVHIFSVLILPMQKEFGWTTSEITGALTVGLFLTDLLAIPAGKWVDAHGGRGIL